MSNITMLWLHMADSMNERFITLLGFLVMRRLIWSRIAVFSLSVFSISLFLCILLCVHLHAFRHLLLAVHNNLVAGVKT